MVKHLRRAGVPGPIALRINSMNSIILSPVVPPSNHIICHLSTTTDPATASKSVLLPYSVSDIGFAVMLICCLHKYSTLIKVDKILYSDVRNTKRVWQVPVHPTIYKDVGPFAECLFIDHRPHLYNSHCPLLCHTP